jgi:uncharacterized protein YndB with AHSA1/START domain
VGQSQPNPSPTAAVDAGTVRVRIRVSRAPEVAWLALTDPQRVAKWFGRMDAPWLVGRAGAIDFGDGDFFAVTATEVVDGKLVEFEWSFLGVGPAGRIRWIVNTLPTGCEVMVEDHDPNRTPAEVDQLVAGWTDFFERLQSYLETGRATRYEWREDIDGSVELPATGFRPLGEDTIYRWLPIATDGFGPRWFFVVDDEGPRRFRVDGFTRRSDREVTFTVEVPEAATPTRCRVAVEQARSGHRLLFSHTGWRAIGLPDGRSRLLRQRFAASWIAALQHARELAGAADRHHDEA